MSDDDIWVRQDVIERGTIQQGIAQVVGAAASPDDLLWVIGSSGIALRVRKSAAALFGYLGYTCDVDCLDRISAEAADPPLLALLTWLRYWIIRDTNEDQKMTD